jgi:hypothetical protein
MRVLERQRGREGTEIKCILKKIDMRVRIGFMWLRIVKLGNEL